VQLWASINEAFMIISAILIALGWVFIRRGQRETHRKLMLTGAAFATAFFISYVLATLFVGDTTFGGPAKYRLTYQIFLQAHATLATVAAIIGIITLRRALLQRFSLHRRIAPWTATIWLITAASGLVVFLLLFVVYAPGPTTNLFRAITLGHAG
jgi:putative membrane protein